MLPYAKAFKKTQWDYLTLAWRDHNALFSMTCQDVDWEDNLYQWQGRPISIRDYRGKMDPAPDVDDLMKHVKGLVDREVGDFERYVRGKEGDIEIATLSYRFEFPDVAVLAPTWDSRTAYKAVVQEDSVSGSEVSSRFEITSSDFDRSIPVPSGEQLGCLVRGENYPGFDVRQLRTSSAPKCQQECQAEARCKNFYYDDNKRLCWLKSGHETKLSGRDQMHGVSGPKKCNAAESTKTA